MTKLFTPSSTDLTNMVKAAEAKFDAARGLDERISKPGLRATEFGVHEQTSTLVVLARSNGPEKVVDISVLRKFVEALENPNA